MRLLVGVLTTDCHDSESGVLPLNTNILEENINLIHTYNQKWMRNSLLFIPIAYVYLRLRGERSHELNRLLFYWLSLPKVALRLHKVEGFWNLSRHWTRPIRSSVVVIARCCLCRRKSPALHWNEWDRVALSLRVTCSVNRGFILGCQNAAKNR